MKIIIKTKNFELTDPLENSIYKKIGGLKKFLSVFEGHAVQIPGGRDLFETFVEVKRESQHHRKGNVFTAEIKLYVPGKSLFAKAQGSDLAQLIGQVRNELESEIRKHRTKIIDHPRRQIRKSQQQNQY